MRSNEICELFLAALLMNCFLMLPTFLSFILNEKSLLDQLCEVAADGISTILFQALLLLYVAFVNTLDTQLFC